MVNGQGVGFGYQTSGIATTPIEQVPTFVCGLAQNVLKKITFLFPARQSAFLTANL
jgi:hypothetical protein